MRNLKEQFLLNPDVVYLNHGSFGATPRPVFSVYQDWQRRLEFQPVQMMIRELPAHLEEARRILGSFINSSAEDVAFIPNATFGANVVARSLDLGPGDEVLATDHEYGACNNVWHYLSRKRGFSYVQQPISIPVRSMGATAEAFWQGVSPSTKVVYLSHITSPTATRLPVEEICKRSREAGILTVIDGAHTVGQIPLDMQKVGADFYFSNGHKWLCSPKGSAFLYARREAQHLIEPLIVSWGWGENKEFSYGSSFLDTLQWLGTNDMAAYLSVPAAIDFQEKHHWPAVREQCHELLREAIQRVCDVTGMSTYYLDDRSHHQMGIVALPPIGDLDAFKTSLIDEFRVEIPCIQWRHHQFIRISVQAYNSKADIDALVKALRILLPRFQA